MYKNTELLDLQKISAVLDVSDGFLYPENTDVGGERYLIIMENIKIQLNDKRIELEEQDYIFGMIFHKLYTEVLVYLINYRDTIAKVEKIDEKKVEEILQSLKILRNLNEDIDDIIEELTDYIFMDELYDICAEIRNIFLIAGSIVRNFFEENNNFNICSCDIVKKIQDTAQTKLRKIYENRIREGDSKIKNLKFKEYEQNITFDLDIADDIIDAHRIGAFFQDGSDDFLNKYEELFPECETIEDIITICEMVLKLRHSVNRELLIDQFEYECIYYILLAIKDLHNKCDIPMREKYFDWNNFETYCNVYKSQRDNENFHIEKEKLIENLLRFPFLGWQYNLIIKYMGDKNLEVERFANIFEIDLKIIKRAEIKKYFLRLGNIDINDETHVKKAYEDICAYKEYLGYSDIEEFENCLLQKLKEFDVIHKTVNGRLYDSLEKADEVRSRSFEGKEYTTNEQVELVKKEVESIRSSYADNKNTLDKYNTYEYLYGQVWETEEARFELDKLKQTMEAEYQELKKVLIV